MKKSDLRQLRDNYNLFTRNVNRDILQAYARPSRAKLIIWRNLETDCEHHGGHGLTVLSNNSHFFTAGFEYPDAETGELRFRYFTASKTLDALVSDFAHID